MDRSVVATDTIYLLGGGSVGAAERIDSPLDEMIYTATTAALDDAKLGVEEIDAVCVAASDVLDGRGISTMTLSGSAGALGKLEARVCEDGLVALVLASALISSGEARRVVVAAWSKLDDADYDSMAPLGLEPMFSRPLPLSDAVLIGLQTSHARGVPVVVDHSPAQGGDGAVAYVVGGFEDPESRPPSSSRGRVLGLGQSSGHYLSASDEPLGALREAASAAIERAGTGGSDVMNVYCGGFHDIADEQLLRALNLEGGEVIRCQPHRVETGYAAGLFALRDALVAGDPGPSLVIGASGIGIQNAAAAVVQA